MKQFSERDFGIGKEPSNTCPMIDSVISKINYCLKMSNKCTEDDEGKDLYSVIFDMQYELDKLESTLEDIRSHVIDIRGWGNEWKNTAIELKNDVENMESQEDILNNQIQDLKDEIYCLKNDSD